MESETFPILFALLLSPYLQYIRFPRMFSTTVSKLDSTSTNRNSPSLFYREKGLSQRHAQFLQLIYHGQIPEYGSIERGDILTRATKLAEETLRAISSLRGGAGRKRSRGFTEDDQARIALAAKRKSQSSRCKTGLGFSGESASKNAKHTGPGGFDEDMKNHYDNHGRKRQTMQERRQGISHPLKKFHNQVKRKMIMRFCSRHSNRSGEGLRLLDLACGRGGDLNKWGSAGISFVRGIDLSPAEIEEAKRRLSSTRRQFPRLEVAFEQSDDCGRKLLPELKGQYDAVTCMFAAHYFFKDETMAKTFLTNVKAALKPGGYFFGTVPDGKAVMTRIGNSSHFENSILVLEKKWEGNASAFGSPFIFKITDTVTDGGKGSREYLVFSSVFKKLASKYGFEPVLDYDDRQLEDLLDPKDRGQFLKHFNPHYSNEDLEVVSRLNTAFCFRLRRE